MAFFIGYYVAIFSFAHYGIFNMLTFSKIIHSARTDNITWQSEDKSAGSRTF
jgi:hypothetical protein